MMHKITLRLLLLGCAAASVLALAAAFVAQYGFGLHPCELCIAQRYPYAAVILLAGGALLLPLPRTVRVWIAAACGLLFLVDAGIAFYHTGVELSWFPGPDACSADAGGREMTLEEMRAQIMGAPLVLCSQAMAYVFGLSLAAWNALLASALAFATFFLLSRKHVRAS